MASIWRRGSYQFCARVRLQGITKTRTFSTRREAENWARILEGKISGDDLVDQSKARETSLIQALSWYEKNIVPKTPRSAQTKLGLIKYWKASKFADWSLVSIRPWDLLEWRREALDEDNTTDGQQTGPQAEFGPQSVIHRLNLISHLYGQWSLVHQVPLDNPVVRGVRPLLDNSRDRRLDPQPDEDGKTEEDRLYEVCNSSKSAWLSAAVRIAIETCIRQSELATLTWGHVHLSGDYPYIDLPRTKNDRPRRVPLSTRAVKAFHTLLPDNKVKISKKAVLPIETTRAIGHAFRTAVKDEQFPNLRWHDLRHEGVSRLFENTDLRDHEIMTITGHLSPEMLKRYSHLRSHRLASRLG